jgi:polar amino acid transport system substrate-binding protein
MKLIKTLLIACSLLVAATTTMARSLDDIKKDGKIILATEGQFAPFNYFQGSKLAGFEIELAEAVAKRMGLKVEWKALGFDALLSGLSQDRWDLVIASHGITDERAKAVTFTEPHYCSGGVVVSLDPTIRTSQDLNGRIIAVQTGTTYGDNLKKQGLGKEVKNFPQDTDARSALLAKRVDVWVTDRFLAKRNAESNPKLGLKVGEYVFVERVAAAVSKGNTSLAQGYNAALAEMLQDGSYSALSKKHFNEDIRCH